MQKVARTAEAETSGATREIILEAALEAFAEKGFDGATTREIATRAGVNHGLIRYYFGGKPKLWRDAVDRAFGELEAGLDSVRNDTSIADHRERAGMMIRSFVRYVGHNPQFVRLMHEEGKRKGPRMRWLVDRHVKPLYEGVCEMAREVAGNQLERLDIPLIHFHYILAGSVSFIFHQAEECKRLSGVDPTDDAVIEEHARIVEQLILGPLNEEKSP